MAEKKKNIQAGDEYSAKNLDGSVPPSVTRVNGASCPALPVSMHSLDGCRLAQ